MLRLRVAVAAVALVSSSAAVAHAQSAPPGTSEQESRPARAQALATLGSFELTPAQKMKIDSIATRHSAEMKGVGELLATDPSEAMRRMVALRTRMQKEVRVLLTTDQRAIFDRNVAEMNAQMNAHMPSGPP